MKNILILTIILLATSYCYGQLEEVEFKDAFIETSLDKKSDTNYVVELNIHSDLLNQYPYLLIKRKGKENKKVKITTEYIETGKDKEKVKFTLIKLMEGEMLPDMILISEKSDSLILHKEYVEFRNVTGEFTEPPTKKQKEQWAKEKQARLKQQEAEMKKNIR